MGRSTKAVRHRRVFTAEFKLEAVRRMEERRGHGVSLAVEARHRLPLPEGGANGP